jgi:hypothetical protein
MRQILGMTSFSGFFMRAGGKRTVRGNRGQKSFKWHIAKLSRMRRQFCKVFLLVSMDFSVVILQKKKMCPFCNQSFYFLFLLQVLDFLKKVFGGYFQNDDFFSLAWGTKKSEG